MTVATTALEEFQASHRNHLGKALRVDGVRGPETAWAAAFETLCQARQSIVTAAQTYIGLDEDPPGSNDDPRGIIRAWLRRSGALPGDPWCAAFAAWCISSGVTAPVRVAGAQALGKRFRATNRPLAGDVMWFPKGPIFGHCGIVIGVGPFEVICIEGNCANAIRCVRRDRAELRFSCTVEDTSGTGPGLVPSVPPAPAATR